MKGLVYFANGYGTFPEKKSEYETAFVFVREEYDSPDVPPWAIKLISYCRGNLFEKIVNQMNLRKRSSFSVLKKSQYLKVSE